MSSGYTDVLLLEACVPWWPDRGDISLLSMEAKEEHCAGDEKCTDSQYYSSYLMTFFSSITSEPAYFDPLCVNNSEDGASCNTEECSSCPECRLSPALLSPSRKSYGLSRLGRITLALEAELFPTISEIRAGGIDTVCSSYVQVRNPFDFKFVRMPVLHFPKECVSLSQLRQLFHLGGVRIVPASVLARRGCTCSSVWSIAFVKSTQLILKENGKKEMLTLEEPACTDKLSGPSVSPSLSNNAHIGTAFMWLLTFLPSLIPHTLAHARQSISLWLTEYTRSSCKFLFEKLCVLSPDRVSRTPSLLTMTLNGPLGSGKKLVLRYLYREFCQQIQGPRSTEEQGDKGGNYVFCYVPYRRSIHLTSLLALEEDEAIAAVRQVMRPPPVVPIPIDSVCNTSQGSIGRYSTNLPRRAPLRVALPLLWITIHDVDLLTYRSNSAAAAVSYEILKHLEALRKRTPIVNYVDSSNAKRYAASTVTLHPPVIVWATTLSGANHFQAKEGNYSAEEGGKLSCSAALSSSLLSMLMSCGAASMLQLAHPTLEERRHFLSHAWKDHLSKLGCPERFESSDVNATIFKGLLDTLSTDDFFYHCLKILQDRQVMSLPHTITDAASVKDLNVIRESDNIYARLYGLETVINRLESHLIWPVTHLHLLKTFHVPCVKGALLCGPSGCGKTALLTLLAQRLMKHNTEAEIEEKRILPENPQASLMPIHIMVRDGLTLIEKEVGKTEENISSLFQEARAKAPTVLFLDNLDALAPPRGQNVADSHAASDRILSTLLVEMDGLGSRTPSKDSPFESLVVLVASAPSLDRLDPAVYRAGRLDLHLYLTAPALPKSVAAMVDRIWVTLKKRFYSNTMEVIVEEGHPVKKRLEELAYNRLASRCQLESQKADNGDINFISVPPSAAIVLADVRDITLYLLSFSEFTLDYNGEEFCSDTEDDSKCDLQFNADTFCIHALEKAFMNLA